MDESVPIYNPSISIHPAHISTMWVQQALHTLIECSRIYRIQREGFSILPPRTSNFQIATAHYIMVLFTHPGYLGKPIHIPEQGSHMLNCLKYLYRRRIGVVGDLVWINGCNTSAREAVRERKLLCNRVNYCL
jgi:hypothetical protein